MQVIFVYNGYYICSVEQFGLREKGIILNAKQSKSNTILAVVLLVLVLLVIVTMNSKRQAAMESSMQKLHNNYFQAGNGIISDEAYPKYTNQCRLAILVVAKTDCSHRLTNYKKGLALYTIFSANL